jgi:hypothetical protein
MNTDTPQRPALAPPYPAVKRHRRVRGPQLIACIAVAAALAMTPGCSSIDSTSVGSLSSTSSNGSSRSGTVSAKESSRPAASPSRTVAAGPAGDYLGCGQYCRTAGGYGGGSDLRNILLLRNRTAQLVDNMIPLDVVCDLRITCRGAIVIFSEVNPSTDIEVGRSDLSVSGKSSRRILVPASAQAVGLLRRQGRLLLYVVLDGGLIQTCPTNVSCINLDATLVLKK